MNKVPAIAALLLASLAAHGTEFAVLCADRTAMERVYHTHRLGTKSPFEQAMPPALVEQLVRQDLHKEAVLLANYGVAITPAMVEAEVQRINTTTRAPDVLAELKAALGNDPGRFARSMARPILVERILRLRFENDDALHAPQRTLAAQTRDRLRAARDAALALALLKETKDGQTTEATWQLASRPAEDTPAPSVVSTPMQNKARSMAYSVEATAQLSQVIASPDQAAPGREKFYFEDLDPELQNVLRVQLQKPGDVSAVIETPGGFFVFLAKERSATALRVASLSIPKRSYEAWLAQQPEDKT